MPDDPAKPPRFPYIAALLCAACVGAAAWTWMRYSYAWEGHAIPYVRGLGPLGWPSDSYCRARVRIRERLPSKPAEPVVLHAAMEGTESILVVHVDPDSDTPEVGTWVFPRTHVTFTGRLRWDDGWVGKEADGDAVWSRVYLDATASRFHGASIAGLVVGAMGVFVFTVALQHWLRERRKFREEANGFRGHP